MHIRRTTIPTPDPFSLVETVTCHGWYQLAPFVWDPGERRLWRAERGPGGSVFAWSVHQARGGALTLTVHDLPAALPISEARRRARQVLNLDLDLVPFHALCRKSPFLRRAPAGGRMLRGLTAGEDLVKSICGTNVTWTQAVRMANAIGRLGPVFAGPVTIQAWPLPEEIVRAGTRFLRDEARVGYRDAAILQAAERLAADPRAFDHLDDPSTPAAELRRQMAAVRGIGPVTAAYLAMLRGRFDEIVFDSMSRDFFARALGARSPTVRHAERRYASFGEWRGLAHALEVMLWWRAGKPVPPPAGRR